MTQLHKLNLEKTNKSIIGELFSNYIAAFPTNERISLNELTEGIKEETISVFYITDNECNAVSYVIIEHYKLSNLLSYLLTPSEYQKKGYASKILALLLQEYSIKNLPLVLECHSDLVNFYNNRGFNIIKEDHIVPKYNEEGEPTNEKIKFNLMVNRSKEKLGNGTISKISKEIIEMYYN